MDINNANCNVYVFNKLHNIIQNISCVDYDDRIHVSLKKKALNELSKLNHQEIVKTIQSIPKHESKYFHVSIKPFLYPLQDVNHIEYSWADDMYMNPMGTWISCGISWQNFIGDEPNQWSLATYIYEIIPSKTVLKISNLKQFKEFIEKYKKKTKKMSDIIHWNKVKKDYDGLIICPYLGDKIWGKHAVNMHISGSDKWNDYIKQMIGNKWKNNIVITAEWYRHWEEATGVIWKPSTGIKSIKLVKKLDTFDQLNK